MRTSSVLALGLWSPPPPPSLLPEQPTSEMVGSHNVNSVIIIAIINVKEDLPGLSVTHRIWHLAHCTFYPSFIS